MNENDLDLSHATYHQDLSSAGLDPEIGAFYTTIDRIRFLSSYELVATVLQAHGFALNFENLLACLDSFGLGVYARLQSRQVLRGLPVAKHFLPCVHFLLPAKHRKGKLLEKFYETVAGYEAELARLYTQGNALPGQEDPKTVKALRKELKQTQEENEALRAQVENLFGQLGDLRRSQFDLSRAVAAHNLLPAGVRGATVSQINLEDREVTLRVVKATVRAPLALFSRIPEEGTPCLVHVTQGTVKAVFLYEASGHEPETSIGQVLFVEEDQFKVRDQERRTWIIQANNVVEESRIRQLLRGGQVLLSRFENHIVRFVPVSQSTAQHFVDGVRDTIVVHQAQSRRPREPLPEDNSEG